MLKSHNSCFVKSHSKPQDATKGKVRESQKHANCMLKRQEIIKVIRISVLESVDV